MADHLYGTLMRALVAAVVVLLTHAPATAASVQRYMMSGPVTDESAKETVEFLQSSDDADAVVLEIDTPGGDVAAGMQIVHAIEEASPLVVCVVDGDAASMGFAILQSCDQRLMTRRSKLMAHEPSMSAQFEGHPNEWQAMADRMAAEREILAEQCQHRLRVSMAEYRRRTDGGLMWFMTWREAKEINAVDGTARNAREVFDFLRKLP